MADEVRRTASQRFKNPGHIGGQIVQSRAFEPAAALASTAHGLQPSGSEHARQVLKITPAAAGIREQHDRSAGPIKGAFERGAADFDVSVCFNFASASACESAPAFLWSRVLSPAVDASSIS
jgi:hypothetical protein